jgi:2',3'-cyclic-nucleotide 2'-phosphodiesterase (5'-nucleotidase family)
MFDADRSWTRREFLKLTGGAGLLSAFPTLASASAALEPDTVCVSILHTTDLHGHVLPTADYHVVQHKFADGAGKIRTRF